MSFINNLTLKFSLVSHGSDYDNVHIPSATKLAMHRKPNVYQYIGQTIHKFVQQSHLHIGFLRVELTLLQLAGQ